MKQRDSEGVSKTAEQTEGLPAKPDDLSSVAQTHVRKSEPTLVSSQNLHMYTMAFT